MKHCDKRAVTVNVTNICNLRCVYCMASSAEEQENPIVIPMEFAKCGIRDAIEGYPTGIKADTLRFFAPGEVTQRMEIVKECVEYSKSLNRNIHIEMQTNGYFETDEDTNWISENIDDVWFSLDGWASVNDINRPDQFGVGRTAEIENNMKVLMDKGVFVGVRCTVGSDMLTQQSKLVEYYAQMGIKYICLNPITVPVVRNDAGKKPVFQNDIMDFAKGFKDAFAKAEELGCVLSSSLTFNFDESTTISCRSCLPMPQLNPDGSVSCCDKATYRDTKNELKCFLYGEWNPKKKNIEYDEGQIRYLQSRTLDKLPKCSTCSCGEYCAGSCAGRIAYETGDMFQVSDAQCQAIRYLASVLPLGRGIVQHTHP